MDAGHIPCREVLYKLWRRCRREGDVKTVEKLRGLLRSWGCRDCVVGDNRQRLISSSAKQTQSGLLHV